MTHHTPTPFDFQSRDIERLSQAYRRAGRVVYVLPTGGGKTFVFSEITRRVVARSGRVLILVHRQELLQQASASLERLGVPHGLIQAWQRTDLQQLVQVASVQTLVRRLDKFDPDAFRLLIIDEAHHAVAGTWAKVLRYFSGAKLLGVTATPIRGDGRGLGEVFEEMVLGPSAAELTELGHLARARVFAPPIGFSAKGLMRTRMGDYDAQEAGERLMVTTVMGSAVGHYQQHLRGATAVAFCCSIRHAQATAEAFRAAGVRAASIDGNTPNRGELLRDLGTGALQVLTSCELIGEGVDVPSVGGCILLRPTQSEGLHLQMIGRCLRPSEGKDAAVLDHVGNVSRLGHHLEEREWTLDGVRKRAQEGGSGMALRECPACYAAMPGGVPICEECGHMFVVRTATIQTVEGQLQEVLMQRRERKREQASARSFEDLVEIGRRRGMKNPHGWARHVMLARGRR